MRTIFTNGIIYTGSLPCVSAFAVEDNHFIFAGSTEDALKLQTPDSTLVNLAGHFVCSGFNDSHMHLLGYGNMLRSAILSEHTSSLHDMIQYMRQFSEGKSLDHSHWLYGRGWNQDYFKDVARMPTRWDLDQISDKYPICAVRACGHCLVVNSYVINMLQITAQTPQPDGGAIGIENGDVNGLFFDNAMDLVYPHIPAPDKAQVKDMIRSACSALNQYGVTSCQTDDYCMSREIPWTTIHEAYWDLEREGELTVRVTEQSNLTSLEMLKQFIAEGNLTEHQSQFFKIGPLKMLGDGALGARTAFLTEPYEDDPTTCGLPVYSQETMDSMVDYANRNGMQVAIHAIGDACLDRVLHAIELALKNYPRKDHRHGVVHCQITRPDQLQKIIELNLQVYAQSIFLDYDNHIVENRVGSSRASTSYNWKTLIDQGVVVSNGTDCPVELPKALSGMECAITRCSVSDSYGPYLPEQAFSVQEAIDSYTSASAHASFEESIKGKIAPGFLADFVILEQDLFSIPANQIHNVKVLQTFTNGQCVYRSVK